MFKVKIDGKELVFEEKVSILSMIDEDKRKDYVAAKVNNRLRELNYEVYFDCEIRHLNLEDSDAVKVYETSLRYLMAMACYRVCPQIDIRFSYNVSRSIFCHCVEANKSIDRTVIAL